MDAQTFLRQILLIRYTHLIERIRDKLSIDEATQTTLLESLARIDWIDKSLDEIKSLPVT
jgi:hypothetical protein